jgi:hypothetical protein
MYIVTSKPKRMSEYSGLVHMINTSQKLILNVGFQIRLGNHNSYNT